MAGSLLSCTACLRRTLQVAARGSTAAKAAALRGAVSLRTRSRPCATSAIAEHVDAPRSLQVEPEDPTVAEKKEKAKLQRAVNKQLTYIDDPWKIAQHIEQTLAKDRFDEALLLTQKASKDRQVVVAWNHLLGYQLEKQQLKTAIKLYNEMKKRGQLPNVQTFTVIFRGCARSQHPKAAVAEAVKHYNILLSDQRLQPNSIHLNAVLNVCARAGDLDSMFLIADSVNDSTRAPTAYTYTTILNALRHHGLQEMKDLPQEQQAANMQKVVDRSKGLWTEVMEKWNQGRLVIDEELVCAMGRVLLAAPRREDKRDVLDLLQQTMRIPNLTKAVPDSDPFQDPDMRNIAASGSSKPVARSKTVYAVPGRNTLALVLSTLASSKLTTVGIKYWNLMVRHYGIVPDNDNWLRMFGMLKVAKASAHAAAILDIMPDEYVDPKPYRIAMETCIRDNINPNAIQNSTTVLDSMANRLPVPDLHTLRLYLRVALVSHFHLRARAQNGDEDAAKREYGVQITTALARLWEPYKKVHYHYFKAAPRPADKKEEGVLYNSKREVIALARLMFSAFNKVANERMLPEKDLREMRPVGAKINREIQTFYSNREELEPKLRPPSARDESADEGSEDVADHGFRPGGDFVWDTATKGSDPTWRREEISRRGETLRRRGTRRRESGRRDDTKKRDETWKRAFEQRR
ncbi:Pentatricopeptide repeat-containing protein 2, mitochondrial [Tolypocladium ophioglossoides CBS 100239]|uniref:Pentatricopeptide repeat-containing protein 2, mitochondrial n=1 Tax=Tolypocladium ophioglossoides (strain CBS 100239) TaxID=1163406 RepID=A0A0L0NFK3_TOLOC|nr:Pentatricopeptide repeat-containing protein 2, mitochondrial [Tolypocladium ophioglossoides CBS 100239]